MSALHAYGIGLLHRCTWSHVLFILQAASKRRADKMLRQQLEDQKKAYDELRRKVEMLQSAQDDPSRSTGGSYAEFVQLREIGPPEKSEMDVLSESMLGSEKVDLQEKIEDQIRQEEEAGLQTIVEENNFASDSDVPTSPAPYLVSVYNSYLSTHSVHSVWVLHA